MKNSIPQDWKFVTSSEILDVRDGTHNTPKYVANGIPLITSKNLKGNKIDFSNVNYISEEDHNEISKRSKVEDGDILFAMIGTIGNPAIIRGNGNFSIKNVGLFKKNEKIILSEFFVNYLRSEIFNKQLVDEKLLNGTTQKFISLGNLRKINIPLPPLPEQHLIVSKIEELFSELDKGIENLQLGLAQLKTYRQSVLKWAFEGRLTNKNVTEGELPKGWKKESLRDLLLFIGSGSTPKGGQNVYQEKGIMLLRSQNVYPNELYLDDVAYISNEIDDKLKRSRVYPYDVLLNITGASIGRCTFVPDPFPKANVNQHVCILRTSQEVVNCKFLSMYLNSTAAQNEIMNTQSGATRQGLNYEQIRNFIMPICSIKEQEKIIQEIESRLSVADKMEETITHSLQQAEALRQSILKMAFEGRLV